MAGGFKNFRGTHTKFSVYKKNDRVNGNENYTVLG